MATKTSSKRKASSDLAARLKDISGIMTDISDQRDALNATTDRPGTDMICILVGCFPPAKTKATGKDYTEFKILVGGATPLGDDSVDDATGDVTLHGVFKPGGRNDPNPRPQHLTLKYGSVQKVKVWREFHGSVGDLVEVKGIHPSYYVSQQTDELTCSLNCNRVNVLAHGRYSIANQILFEADLLTKTLSRPDLISDEAIQYLVLKRQNRDLAPMAGVFKFGDTVILPMWALTTDEKRKMVARPKGMLLNAQYAMGKYDAWVFKSQKEANRPPEVCMRNVTLYCATWKDGAWDKREQSIVTVTCWARQLAVFGLNPNSVSLWENVIRYYVPLTEIVVVGEINLLDTSQNELNRFRILGEGDSPQAHTPLKFVLNVQGNALLFDAPAHFRRYGIDVSAKWVYEYLASLKPKPGIDGGHIKTRGAPIKAPSDEVICVSDYFGNFAELDKVTASYVVLTSYAPSFRNTLNKFAAFMRKIKQPAREGLLTELINAQPDEMDKLEERNKYLAEFFKMTSKPPDGRVRLCIFAIKGAKTKEGAEAQRKFEQDLVSRFLGEAATEDQAKARSGKRSKAAPSADVHA